jgi:hypothetical protein
MAHDRYGFRGFLNYFFKYGDWCGRNTGRYLKFETQCARCAEFSLSVGINLDVWNSCPRSADFHANCQDSVCLQNHFALRGRHLARPLATPHSTKLLSSGLRQKLVTRNMYCQSRWLKIANSLVISRDPWRNSQKCYDIHPIATAGVY